MKYLKTKDELDARRRQDRRKTVTGSKSETAHRTAGLVYCLWLLGILFGITAVVGAIINYTHLDKARDTHAYSHFLWQMISFWIVLAGIAISLIMWPDPVAQLIAITTFFVWLFSGLIGSWYLSKSRRLNILDRQHRSERHQRHYMSSKSNQPLPVEVEAGKDYFWCSCGKSAKQPFCDGSHKGSEFTPVKYTAEKDGRVFFCGCKETKNAPLCDGTHKTL